VSSRIEQFSVSNDPEVAIWQASGSVKVVEGKPGSISVSIHGAGADEIPIRQYDDRIEVGTDRKMRSSFTTVLSLPPDTRLTVALTSAAFDATSPLARLDLKSASSTVTVKHVSGDAAIKVASGDVSVEKASGRLRVAAASGDIRVGLSEGDCICSTASGDIEIDLATDCVEMKTASGGLIVRRVSGSEVQAKSMSGDVEIGIQPGTRVELDLKTATGRVVLPKKAGKADAEPASRMKIATKSLSGDIIIKRA
jgi:hypothetical protein